MNANASIRIDDLRLRVPGLTGEQARQLGESVARRLADLHLGATSAKTIPALALRVRSRSTFSVDCLADDIVSGIHRSLK